MAELNPAEQPKIQVPGIVDWMRSPNAPEWEHLPRPTFAVAKLYASPEYAGFLWTFDPRKVATEAEFAQKMADPNSHILRPIGDSFNVIDIVRHKASGDDYIIVSISLIKTGFVIPQNALVTNGNFTNHYLFWPALIAVGSIAGIATLVKKR